MYVLFYICGAAAADCQLLNKRICYVLCYAFTAFYCDKTCYLVYYSKSPNMTLLLNKQYRAYI